MNCNANANFSVPNKPSYSEIKNLLLQYERNDHVASLTLMFIWRIAEEKYRHSLQFLKSILIYAEHIHIINKKVIPPSPQKDQIFEPKYN